MTKKIASEDKIQIDRNQALDRRLRELKIEGFADLTKKVDEWQARTVSTGFPELDRAIHPYIPGFPWGCNVEIFSELGSAGKSTVVATIVRHWQRATHYMKFADDLITPVRIALDEPLKIAWIENEGTTTPEYLQHLGVAVKPEQIKDGYHLRWLPSFHLGWPAEKILETVDKISNDFDMVVIDSIDSLEQEGDKQKSLEDNRRTGGLSGLLGWFYRHNTDRRATIVGINQSRCTMQTNAAGRPITTTSGGRAMNFYSSLRIQLAEIQRIKHGEDVWAVRTNFYLAKNKIAPEYTSTTLVRILGQGYSQSYNMMEIGIKSGIIAKGGSWYSIMDKKVQGEQGLHELIESSAEVRSFLEAEVSKYYDGNGA